MKLIGWKRVCWGTKKENNFSRTGETHQISIREQELAQCSVLFEEEEEQWGLTGQRVQDYLEFRFASTDNLLHDLGQACFFSPHLLLAQFVLPYPFKLEALMMGFGSKCVFKQKLKWRDLRLCCGAQGATVIQTIIKKNEWCTILAWIIGYLLRPFFLPDHLCAKKFCLLREYSINNK